MPFVHRQIDSHRSPCHAKSCPSSSDCFLRSSNTPAIADSPISPFMSSYLHNASPPLPLHFRTFKKYQMANPAPAPNRTTSKVRSAHSMRQRRFFLRCFANQSFLLSFKVNVLVELFVLVPGVLAGSTLPSSAICTAVEKRFQNCGSRTRPISCGGCDSGLVNWTCWSGDG